MRLRKYLQEKDVLELANEVSDFNDMIEKDCKQYLKLIKGKLPLFRGIQGISDFYGKKKVRKNRKSLGMSQEVFKEFNKGLEENGHNRRDKSISVITNPSSAENFGKAYYIFPIGKMSYSGIMANDVNIPDKETGGNGGGAIEDYLMNNTDPTEKGFENYFFTDKGFDKAYKNSGEIGINCDSYYFIDVITLRDVAKGYKDEQRFK